MAERKITDSQQTESLDSIFVNDGGNLRQIPKEKAREALGITDAESNIDGLKSDLGEISNEVYYSKVNIVNDDVVADTSGKYLTTGLEEKDGTGSWMLTDYLPIKEGTIINYSIHFYGGVLGISFYNDDKKYLIGKTVDSGHTLEESTILAPINCEYVRFCFGKYVSSHGENQYVKYNVSNVIENRKSIEKLNNNTKIHEISIVCDDTLGKYYVDGGGKLKDGGENWRTTDFLKVVKNTEISYSICGISSVNAISFYDKSYRFISGINPTTSTLSTIIGKVTPPETAEYARFCFQNGDSSKPVEYVKYSYSENDMRYYDLNSELEIYGASPLSAFDNILCIGDSLTYSQVATDNTYENSHQAKNPYPKVLSKYLGCDGYKIVAVPGETARGMWLYHNHEITQAENQIAIIYLGTNGGITDTVEIDCPVGVDYNNFTDNHCGSMGKLISKCQEVGCKVLLLKPYYLSSYHDVTNSAIDHLGERFGCAVMDAPNGTMYEDLMLWGNHNGNGYPHYNELGYSWFARKLADSVVLKCGRTLRHLIPTN